MIWMIHDCFTQFYINHAGKVWGLVSAVWHVISDLFPLEVINGATRSFECGIIKSLSVRNVTVTKDVRSPGAITRVRGQYRHPFVGLFTG